MRPAPAARLAARVRACVRALPAVHQNMHARHAGPCALPARPCVLANAHVYGEVERGGAFPCTCSACIGGVRPLQPARATCLTGLCGTYTWRKELYALPLSAHPPHPTPAGSGLGRAHSTSSVEVARMLDEALDAMYGLAVPVPYDATAALLAGMDGVLRKCVRACVRAWAHGGVPGHTSVGVAQGCIGVAMVGGWLVNSHQPVDTWHHHDMLARVRTPARGARGKRIPTVCHAVPPMEWKYARLCMQQRRRQKHARWGGRGGGGKGHAWAAALIDASRLASLLLAPRPAPPRPAFAAGTPRT